MLRSTRSRCHRWRCLAALAPALILTASSARAELVTVDFASSHNARMQNLAGQAASFPEGSVTLGGVPFEIPAGGDNIWAAGLAAGPNPRTLVIPVGVFGVDAVYTLINSWWGETTPGTKASIEFVGSEGAFLAIDLDGGDDIRDYLENTFTNTINGASTVNVFTAGAGIDDEVRLDRQRIDLPEAFDDQVLETIRILDDGANDNGMGTNDPQRVFAAGITLDVPLRVPALTPLGLGVLAGGLLGAARRSRRRRSRAP